MRRAADVARLYAAAFAIVPETELLEGDAAERILELARARGAELVVKRARRERRAA